jgi:hypothetical protein
MIRQMRSSNGCLLCMATVSVAALTATLSSSPSRRRAAREVLALLLRRGRDQR